MLKNADILDSSESAVITLEVINVQQIEKVVPDLDPQAYISRFWAAATRSPI